MLLHVLRILCEQMNEVFLLIFSFEKHFVRNILRNTLLSSEC